MGKSPINGVSSIALFDYRRVSKVNKGNHPKSQTVQASELQKRYPHIWYLPGQIITTSLFSLTIDDS